VRVKLFVEGGGDSELQRRQFTESFSKLLQKAGLTGQMPRVVAGGRREQTYALFKAAVGDASAVAVLLVDSEDPVSAAPWDHLRERDRWERPPGATDDQAQLMVTSMETWLMADRAALTRVFGDCLQQSALFAVAGLEARTRQEVQDRLAHATRDCVRDRAYAKGRRSFQVLAEVDPDRLQSLPHFQRLIDALRRLLAPPDASHRGRG